MKLRPLQATDLPAVCGLERCLFGCDAWSQAALAENLGAGDRLALVAVDSSQVVGYMVAVGSGQAVDLQRIGIHPDHRRRGTAAALVAAVVDWAVLDWASCDWASCDWASCDWASCGGGEAVLLEVAESNAAARGFYAAQGFTSISRRRRYYGDGADALVLRLPLQRPAPPYPIGGPAQTGTDGDR